LTTPFKRLGADPTMFFLVSGCWDSGVTLVQGIYIPECDASAKKRSHPSDEYRMTIEANGLT